LIRHIELAVGSKDNAQLEYIGLLERKVLKQKGLLRRLLGIANTEPDAHDSKEQLAAAQEVVWRLVELVRMTHWNLSANMSPSMEVAFVCASRQLS
jgi:hypothetical protein